MKQILLFLATFLFALTAFSQTRPQLGNARTFTVLAGTQITNNGSTVIDGNIGVAPGTTVTGFPPGVVNGTTEINNSISQNAQASVTSAYNTAATQTPTSILTGQNLGGRTLTPGVYKFAGNADFTGALTFDANGDINGLFIIQIDNNFTISPNALMNLRNGARELNIFWQVGGSATIGSSSSVKGTLLVNQNITVNSSATLIGRLFARQGFVLLNQNSLTNPESFITDIAIAKSVNPGPYYSGSTVTFTIVVSNLGPRAATNVIVSDLLTTSLQYQSSQTTTNTTYNPVSGLWTIDSIANGGTHTLVITALVKNTGFITNTATIAFFGDNNINNNTSAITPFCATPEQPGPINGPISLCLGSTGHTYTIGPVAGADYYNWIVPTGWTITSGQGTTAITVNAGTDTLSANIFVTAGSNSCNDESIPSSLVVYATNIPPAAPGAISGPTDLCASQNGLVYSVSPVRGASFYTWSVPSGWTITNGQGTNTITVNAGTNPGPISVTATNGCGTSTGTIMGLTPASTPPPVPGPITGNTVPCSGNAATPFSINNVTGATSYAWTVPSGWTISSGQGTTSIIVTPGTNSGSVTVTAINACGQSGTRTILVNPTTTAPGSPSTISGNTSICASQTNLIYSVPVVSGASSYTWSVPSGWTIISGQGTTSIMVNAGTTPGNITVTASNGCGSSMASSLPVTITNIPTMPAAINGTIVPCIGNSSTNYSIAAVSGATSYTWIIPAGWTLVNGQGSTSITVVPGSSSGTISVSAGNSCGSSGFRSITVTPASTAPGTPGPISGNTIPCVSGTGNIYSITAVANAASYFWTVPSGWTITTGQGTTSITVTAGSSSGNISVSAVNGCGTGPSTTRAVTPVTSRPAAPGPITGTSTVCVGLTGLNYSISPVANASSYTWTVPTGWTITAGQGTTTITVSAGSAGGNVTVAASNGCGLSAATVLAVTPITTVPATPGAISGTNRPCVGNTSVTYTVTAATGASSYNWTVPAGWVITAGQGTTTITVTPGTSSGNVSVTAVNSCGNSPVSSVAATTITTPPATPISISGNTMACANTSGNVYSVPANANATSYTWTVPTGWTITSGQGTSAITTTTGSTGGTITAVAQNDCGSSSAANLTVTPVVLIPAAPGAINGNTQACVGSTGNTYSIAAVATASSYVWTVPTGWTITAGQGTTSIIVTSGSTGGNITVAAVNSCGQGPGTQVSVTPITTVPATPGAISGTNRPCVGNASVTFSVTAVTGAGSYNWTVPAGWVITAGQGTPTITVTPGSASGNVSVTAVNSCGNSPVSSVAATTITTPPATPISISGNTMACANTSGNVYSVPANANATSYTWTVPAGWTITAGQGTTSITVTVGATGGTVTVSAQNDCGASSAANLTVTPVVLIPAAPGAINGNTQACVGSTGNTYSIAAVATASSYVWTVPAGWTITAGQGTTNITVTSGSGTGSVTVAAVNSCGPGPATSLTLTPITTVPATPGPIAGSNVPCVGTTSVTYTVGATSGASSYLWTVPGGWTITAGQGTISITVTPGTTGGNVSVRGVNSCGNSVVSTLAVSPASTPPPAPLTINGDTQACANSSGNVYSVTSSSSASSYTWTVPTGWTITSGQGTASINVNVGTSGGTVTVAALNDCGSSATTSLTVTPVVSIPAAPGAITGNTLTCAGSTGNTYSIAAVATATSYVWTVPTGWTITAGQGTTNITVTSGTGSGTISVAAINSCGSGLATTLNLTPITSVPIAPAAITGSTVPCVGTSSINYTTTGSTGATTYNWTVPTGWVITAGQGTTTITVQPGTTGGNVSVTAENSCGISPAISVPVNPASTPPTVPVTINGNTLACANTTGNIYSVPISSNASSYTWVVPAGWTITSGQGTASINVSAGATGGTITVIATNDCGDSPAASITVTPVISAPATPGPITGNTMACANSSGNTYSISAVATASSYIWTVPTGWSITSGQGTTSIVVTAGTATGTITVEAVNSCGSSPASSLTVSAPTSIPPVPGPISGNTLVCGNQTALNYSVALVPNASSYAWTVPTGWTITAGQGTPGITVTTGNTSGTITVAATNGCGTGTAQTQSITISPVPATPIAITGDSIPCAGSTLITYSVAAVPNATAYTWTAPTGWTITSGQGTTSITVLVGTGSGQITASATNACGASSSAVLSVRSATTVPVTPGPIAGNSALCSGQVGLTYSIQPVANTSSYTWTVPSGWVIVSGQGTPSITVAAGTGAGTIAVAASNGCGAGAASTKAVTLTTSAPGTPSLVSGPINPCTGATTLVYSIPAVTGATTYNWTVPSGWTITSGQGTTSIIVTVGSASGTVSVTAGNDCGDSPAKTLAVVSSGSAPVAPAIIAGTVNPCAGNTNRVYSVVPVSGATSYDWTVPAGWLITAGQGTEMVNVTAGTTSGTILVTAINGCGSSNATSLSVTPVTRTPLQPGSISGPASVCAGQQTVQYSVSSVDSADSYTWTIPAGWTIISGQGTTSITVDAGTNGGQITVTADNDCGSSTASTQTIIISSPLVTPGPIADNSGPCSGLSYSIPALAGATTYNWTVPSGWTIISGQGTTSIQVKTTSTGMGSISVTASNGPCNSNTAAMDADPAKGNNAISIPTAFSPNADNINDTWEIANIENYPENEITVINRWGNEVFKTKSYRNNWDGGGLSAGTYFYVMKVKMCGGEEKSFKGFVMIVK